MANFSITISNSLRMFGVAPSDKWQDYKWNAFKWGEGTADLEVRTTKVIDSGSLTPDSTMVLTVYFNPVIVNTLSVAGDMGSETLLDGSGYSYVFPDDVSDLENRSFPSFTSQVKASNSWASSTAGVSTWS